MFQSIKVEKSPVFLNMSDLDVILANTDTLEFLKTVPDNTVDLVVTSPPYNIGKPYEDKKDFKDYLDFQRNVIKECIRILKDTGSICWQVGNYVEKGEVFPLDIFFYQIFKLDFGLKLRNRIIWHYGHGLHAKKRFSGRYETILWFTKTDTYTFNLDDVRVPAKYPGKRYYRGDKKGQPSCNPKGKNPSDVWEILINDFESCFWNIPNVKANHPEKTIHPCQFPIELVERLVLALTNENDIVLDPFMGVGTSVVAALLHNRKSIGIDKEGKYVDIALQRLKDLEEGKLKRRPLGKPIYTPKGTEKVAQVPEEWKGISLFRESE
ncbi:DNA-methyltransferase [Hydrogenivirga sp.]